MNNGIVSEDLVQVIIRMQEKIRFLNRVTLVLGMEVMGLCMVLFVMTWRLSEALPFY